MKKEILVFIFDGYADWESAYGKKTILDMVEEANG